MIDRAARRVGAIGTDTSGVFTPPANPDWHGRMVRELWRAAWRAHQSEVLLVAAVVLGGSAVVAALPYLEARVAGPGLWYAASADGGLSAFGGRIAAILLAAFCGARFGGGEAVAGTEAFALALPPTRAQRYAARYTLGLGTVLALTAVAVLIWAPLILPQWVLYRLLALLSGRAATFGSMPAWLLDHVLVPAAAAMAAYAMAFAWAANAHTRAKAERAGPLSALLLGTLSVIGPLAVWLISAWLTRWVRPYWITDVYGSLQVVTPGLLLAAMLLLARRFTRRGYRDYLTKEAVDRPLAAGGELRGRPLPRPSRRTIGLLAAVALTLLLALAWWQRPYQLTTTAHLGGALVGRAALVGDLALVDLGNTLATIDLAEPGQPVLLGRTAQPFKTDTSGGLGPGGAARGMEIRDGFAYVLKADAMLRSAYLRVVDIHDPAHPRLAGAGLPLANARAMDQGADALYVLSEELLGDSALQAIDISNPVSPTLRGRVVIEGRTTDLAIGDGQAFVGMVDPDGSTRLGVYDITGGQPRMVTTSVIPFTSPPATRSAGSSEAPAVILRVVADPPHVYLVTSAGELVVVDVMDPERPTQAARLPWGDARSEGQERAMLATSGEGLADATVVGQRLYILDPGGRRLHTIDIADPTAPRHVGVRGLAGGERFLAGGGSRLATTGACQDGFRRCWDSTADTLHVYSTLGDTSPTPAGTFRSFTPEDVAIVGTRAYAAAGDRRLQVLDLADPARPRQIGATGPHGARRVRAAGDRWAFVATSNTGEWPMSRLWRIDLRRPDDPGTPVLSALDLGAVHLDLLAADEGHLLVEIQRRQAGPPNDPFDVATDVLAYRVAADGGIHEIAQLEGVHNALGGALWNDQAIVLSDRYYPPPPDFDPQRGGGYSTTCTGNDLLTYELGPVAAGSATTAVEVSCSSDQLHLDPIGQRLYLYSDHGENLQVLDLTAPGASDPTSAYIASQDSRNLSNSIGNLEAVGDVGFTTGWHGRPGLLDLRDTLHPAVVATEPDAWGSDIRAVDDRHAYVFSRGAGLYAVEAGRGWTVR